MLHVIYAAALQLKYFYLKSVKSKCKKLLKILRHKMFCVRIQFKRTKQHRNKRIIIYPIWSNMARRRHLHDRYRYTFTIFKNTHCLSMCCLWCMDSQNKIHYMQLGRELNKTKNSLAIVSAAANPKSFRSWTLTQQLTDHKCYVWFPRILFAVSLSKIHTNVQ